MATGNPLGRLFGKSPIRPIQEHMELAEEAASFLPQLFQASIDADWERANAVHSQIKAAESGADRLKRKLRQNLPRSLFLPVPRGDLLELITIQDKVANVSKDIGVLVTSRQMRFPQSMEAALMELTEACLMTVGLCVAAIQELDELLEVGFTGQEVKRVEKMLKELDRSEGQCDKKAAKVRRQLFSLEAELPPVDAIFFYRILALLSKLADVAEGVGDRLQIIIAR